MFKKFGKILSECSDLFTFSRKATNGKTDFSFEVLLLEQNIRNSKEPPKHTFCKDSALE